ncbi:hypothetical protein RM533_12080 [Croceicoccus sp. F390]|uniref:Uncharacterized protein n=1 Tax=Croceicoccus esteveae TaxID=3075597 RepID=A0ABU2ZJX3_9SPHN|nr:hypothetical protein [Croceicoccus sp. F390]MDT0576908.1 hypothetical protein [Croceicoccus sp. F390]
MSTQTPAAPSPDQRIAGSEASARLGEHVISGDWQLTPLAVLEDSRCPVDAQCIHAGKVIVLADLANGSQRARIELETGKQHQILDVNVVLVSVLPPKKAERLIHRSDYLFIFRFQP